MQKNDRKDLYDTAYAKFTPDWLSKENLPAISKHIKSNSQSLTDFVEDYLRRFNLNVEQMDVLETGCGLSGFSVEISDRAKSITAVDISSLAISAAESISSLKNKKIKYCRMDITKLDSNLNKKFDLIIDSNLLHCLITTNERLNYFNFLKKHLAAGGQVLIETMCFQKDLQIPLGYYFDESGVLFQDINNAMTPIRKILSSIEIENELTEACFKINYLYYHSELSFAVFEDIPNYPEKYLPKTIRLSVSPR